MIRNQLSTNPATLRRLFEWAGLDQSVVFMLLTRASQAVSGVVTLLLIAKFFAPETQGFYYTFSSLLALQIFFELALYVVIVSLTSHEWSKLRLEDSGSVVGDASALSRLASLARFVAKWYMAMSFIFVLVAGVSGHVFFSQANSSDVAWQKPWWTAVVLAAAQLWLMPFLSLLEGCNQVVVINRFRLLQTLAEALIMWGLLIAGAGLWVVAGSLVVKISGTLFLLLIRYRRFFRSIFAAARQERIRWREDIWPMQWRLAAQGAVHYLAFSLFTPVMFHYHGPKVAGQMGMTLQIIGVVQAMALAWVQPKVPQFGILAAKHEYSELDRIWRRASKLSLSFVVFGSLIVWVAVVILGKLDMELASRILGPFPTALFLTAYGLMQLVYCYAAYLRAHAREPFLFQGLSSGLLIGSLVFFFGSKYGATGAAASYMAAVGLFVVPMGTVIWIRRRAEWHAS